MQNPNSSNELIQSIDAFNLASSFFLNDPYERGKSTLGVQNAVAEVFPGVSAEILDLAKPFDWSNETLDIFEAVIDWRLNAKSNESNFPFVSQIPKFWRE